MEEATRISNSKIDPVSVKVIFWEDELVMEEENDEDTPDWVVDKLPFDFNASAASLCFLTIQV
eukprot:5067068-Ditylum_brightwellii.AAC.1